MIKRYYDITLRDYNLVEQTGKIGHLCKLSFLAIILKKSIERELTKLHKILNEEDKETEKEDIVWQLFSHAKINAIDANYKGAISILKFNLQINILKKYLSRRYRRKIKTTSQNLKYYLDNLKKYTGIDVKNIQDLDKVRKDLQFKKDKYNENYSRQKEGKKVFLMTIALGIFSYLNQPVNVKMTVLEFNQIRKDAYKKLMEDKAKL